MSREKHIKKYLMAAKGGEVPDDYMDDESDDSIDDAPEETAVDANKDDSIPQSFAMNEKPQIEDVPAVSSSTSPIAPSNDIDKQAAIKDYLSKQYAKANDSTAINDARENSSTQNLIANLGQAFEGLARSNSMAHGGQGVNTGLYNNIREQGQQGIQQAQANRQAAIDNFTRENAINRQVAQDTMTKGTYDQQQKAAKYLSDQHDGTSTVSQNAVKAAQGTFKDFPGIADIIQPGMSATEVADALKGLEKKASLDTSKVNKQMFAQHQKDVADEKKNQGDKSAAMKDFEGLAKDMDADLASSRTVLGQARGKVVGAQRVMTFADTTPEEIEKAKSDPKLQAQLKAKFDKLSPQQYVEVVSGLMTQITPGTGSYAQLEHMLTDTSGQRIANVQQYFTNHPVPAGMGASIMNLMTTLKNEQDTGKAVIDEHTAKMQAKHPHAFAHEATSDIAKNLLSKYQGDAQVANNQQQPNQAPIAAMHPEADQAAVWAKDPKNANDPRAQKILKMLGTVMGSN